MKECMVSQYLNVIDLDDRYLLMNGFNGCIDEVTKEFGEVLKTNSYVKRGEFFTDEEIEFLLSRGHITMLNSEEEMNEFKKIAESIDKLICKRSENRGSLMLLLSYECNLDCHYCYQTPIRKKKMGKVMNTEFIDELFNADYEKILGGIAKKDISVNFYGGEPFLRKNRETVERVLFYAKKYGIKVSAISNCTQIDEYYDLLGPLPGQINECQVSLDGDKENHDKSRIPVNGAETFDKIISNVHKMLDKKVNINVRVNIQSESLDKLPELYKFLKDEDILDHPYANVYVHPLHNHYNQTDDSKFLSQEEVYTKLAQLNEGFNVRHPVIRTSETLDGIFNMDKGIPFKRTRFCMMNIPNNYLIDAHGDIYSCYEEAGREEAVIGRLRAGVITFNSLRDTYLNRAIHNMDKCLKCSVALMCGGECGIQAKQVNDDLYVPHCDMKKEKVFEAVKYLYKKGNYDKIDDSMMKYFNICS